MYNLQSEVTKCKTILDEIDTLIDGVLEHDMTVDQIANVLIGMKDLYTIKFNRLQDAIHHDSNQAV